MQFTVKSVTAATHKTAAMVVGVFEGRKLSAPAQQLDAASGGQVLAAVKASALEGKAGQALSLFRVSGLAAEWLVLVGLGKADDLTPKALRKAAAQAAKLLDEAGISEAVSLLAELCTLAGELVVLGFTLWLMFKITQFAGDYGEALPPVESTASSTSVA